MEKYLKQTEKQNVKSFINRQIKNHIKDNPENVGEIEHIIDLLNSKDCPQDLKTVSYSEMKNRAENWVKKLIKKAEKVVEVETDTKIEIDFEDGMKLVRLVGKSAFNREGNLMSHCVGSYHGKDVKIFSLRDHKNNPHCTIEVDQGINQIKGKGNGSIHPKYIEYIIKSLDHFGLKVRSSELENLGYSQLSEDLWKLVEREFIGIKSLNYDGEKFLYNDSKLVRIPKIPA